MRALLAGIAVTLAVAMGSAVAAAAPRGHVAHALDRGNAEVDWTRGMLSATGAAAADLRAPNPTVARIRAERIARERARQALGAQARALRAAGEGSVGEALDAAAEARLEAAIERALELELTYGSDGSTTVSLGLPLEEVRQAIAGPAAPSPAAAPPVTAIVVEAGRAMRQPAVGVGLRAGDARYAGPTVYHRAVKSALADPRAGDQVVRVRATERDGDALVLAEGDVAAWRDANPLVIVVLGGRR